MNDMLLILQMLQNGDIGGGAGSDQPFVIIDQTSQIQNIMKFIAGNHNFSGYISEQSNPNNNQYLFTVGHTDEGDPFVFDSNSDLIATLNNIVNGISSDANAGSLFNNKILIIDEKGMAIMDKFILLHHSIGNDMLCCNFHFEDTLGSNTYEGDAVGVFDGKLYFIKADGQTAAGMDARYGVCNLHLIPHQPL